MVNVTKLENEGSLMECGSSVQTIISI